MTKTLSVLLLSVAWLVAAPTTAGAATAGVETTYCEGDACRYCGSRCDTSRLVLRAAPGETNRLTVRSDGDRVTFSDAGAPLHAGAQCAQVDPATVTCPGVSSPWLLLGDRDDSIEGSGAAETIDAGPGADRVRAGAGDDRLEDSDGSPDDIDGGAGTDEISYGSRRRGVGVDLSRSRTSDGGRLTGMEQVSGGEGADRLRGGRGPDRLYGFAGADRLSGAAGDDFLAGGPGRDRYRCGAGRDEVSEPDRRELIPADCERVGSGDAHTVDPHPRMSRDGRTLRFRVSCEDSEYETHCPFTLRVSQRSRRFTVRRRVRGGRAAVLRVRLPVRARDVAVAIDNGVLSLDVAYRLRL